MTPGGDPYLDPAIGDLRNLLGAKTWAVPTKSSRLGNVCYFSQVFGVGTLR